MVEETRVSLKIERYDKLLEAETRIEILRNVVSRMKYVSEDILSIIGVEKAAVTDDKEGDC